MNFAQYLGMTVTPLFDTGLVSCIVSANHAQSIRRFESVIPDDTWVAGSTIAKKLGSTSDSVNKSLKRFKDRGLLECRRINPDHRSLEWRWV